MDISIFKPCSLKDSLLQEIEVFAKSCNHNYGDRNQKDQLRIEQQIKFGKAAEWIVYHRLRPFFVDITKPDMKIYAVKDKDWSPDLKACEGVVKFACKSCDPYTRNRWGSSWQFNYSDKKGHGRDKEIFPERMEDLKEKIVVFVQTENDNSGCIRSVTLLSKLHEHNLFDDPKKEELIGIKKTVYYGALTCVGFKSGIVNPCVTQFVDNLEGSLE